jgi:Flp pilus assembly protein TadG
MLHAHTRTESRKRLSRYDRRGASLIETTIVITLLLMIVIFPSMEFAYFFYVKHTLQGAAREGARSAIVSGAANSDVTTAVQSSMTMAGLQGSGYAVAIRDTADTTDLNVASVTTGPGILVKVTCTWSNVGIRQMGIYRVIPATKAVIGRTIMRKE